MSHATISQAARRGPSASPTLTRRSTHHGFRPTGPAPAAADTPAVIRARRRILEGVYEDDRILSIALDRLIDSVAARLDRASSK